MILAFVVAWLTTLTATTAAAVVATRRAYPH